MDYGTNEVTTTEYLPSLDTELVNPDRVSVRFDIEPRGGTLNFVLTDATAWAPGSGGRAVTRDANGNICLVIERGQDRIFHLELSRNWRWTFDFGALPSQDAITVKRGEPKLYKVNRISDTEVEILARARPGMPTGSASDYFNFFVLMEQDSGSPIALRIDPIANNPPNWP